MFSTFAQSFDAPPNRLYALRRQMIAKRIRFIDLISGDVNAQGIHFPTQVLRPALASGPRVLQRYRPDPLGWLSARRAVARFYADEGLEISPERIVLTPGTSFSYWYLFRLLANPGDEILCPRPSYPLFDTIAASVGATLMPYPLWEASRWTIDCGAIEDAVTPKTKAIVLISPHNPTGAVATTAELRNIAELARRHRLPIIADEVFSPFIFAGGSLPRIAQENAPLVFTLNGFSKMLALPGIKVGWIAVSGEEKLANAAMKQLDMLSDTFLPVNEAAQAAVPALLAGSRRFLPTYVKTIRDRAFLAIDALRKSSAISFAPPEGGFFLTMRLPEGISEEETAIRLLAQHHLLTHPGYFYDFKGDHLVISTVSKPSVFKTALQRLVSDVRV